MKTILGVLILSILVSAALNMPSQEEVRETQARDKAYWCARDEVVRLLKAPSTAEFPRELHRDVTRKAGDSHYVVSSHVDAQNEFGAMVRSQYSCDVYLAGGEGCRAECTVQ